MAESIAFNIAENVIGKLTSFTLQNVVAAYGIEFDLEKIKENLLAIRAVLLDAEQQQAHNRRIGFWLEKLQQVMYDAEDVLDEVECEALRRQVVKSAGSINRQVCRFFSSSNPVAFRFRIADEVKKIRERLAEIAALKSDFGLTEGFYNRQLIHAKRVMTHSFVDAATVIGRDEDKENIINQLLSVANSTENVSVLPIVGMGGLGKTTLAKLVFNDQRVASHFEMEVWVCISEDFDLQKVLEKIIKSATREKCIDWDVEELQKYVRDILKDKKYLLVLDDVWNENPRKWVELKSLLVGGANGSWIVVTTRGNQVALVMGSVPTYDLNYLSNEYCSSLFFKCAFKDEQDKKRYPELVKIGEGIVISRCRGVPLAVVTLGNLLSSTTNEREWKSVRDSDLWQSRESESEILPALRISYENLPSHLKRCFAYCSCFPKDYYFIGQELIQFWMAHGLLQQKNDNEELEEIGLAYLKELCARSFFQDIDRSNGYINCKMHDLIHDLAISLTRNECSVITATKQISNNGRHRHLLFADPTSVPKGLLSNLRDIDHVRSISPYTEGRGFSRQSVRDLHLSRFQCLRWLNLSGSDTEILPEDIGKLKHLRFLNLNHSKIKRLPKSIYKLQSLQALWILGCEELEELHSDIRFLINLRSLMITTKQKCLSKNGIGCLTSLQLLVIDYCENMECLFEDMQGLSSLRTLILMGCGRLISLPQSMKNLPALEILLIVQCENLDLKMEGESRFCLQELTIVGLQKLVELPRWIIQNTLQSLTLENCPNLQKMPDYLNNLSSLQLLAIGDCGELSQRCKPQTGEDWSKIAHIPNISIDGSDIKQLMIHTH